MNKFREYIEGVQKEMKKVVWPSQKELLDNTNVTIFFSIFLSLFIFLVDQGYSTALKFIYDLVR